MIEPCRCMRGRYDDTLCENCGGCPACREHELAGFTTSRYARVSQHLRIVETQYLADVEVDWERGHHRVIINRVATAPMIAPGVYECTICGATIFGRIAKELYLRVWPLLCYAIVNAVAHSVARRTPTCEEDFVLVVRHRQMNAGGYFYTVGPGGFAIWWRGWTFEAQYESETIYEERIRCMICRQHLATIRGDKRGGHVTILWSSERPDLVWMDLTRDDTAAVAQTHANECAMRHY